MPLRPDATFLFFCRDERTERQVVGQVLRSSACRTRVLNIGGQATKGAWGMSWRQKAKKGVEVCDKLGEADKRVLIPRYPK
jgi:hypothetical protein